MDNKDNKKQTLLTYKGRPLVRSGNIIYYGNMTDEYVVMMQIQGSNQVGKLDIASKVLVQLISTNEQLRLKERIIKKSEKDGLYNALDIGSIWLERVLSEKKD